MNPDEPETFTTTTTNQVIRGGERGRGKGRGGRIVKPERERIKNRRRREKRGADRGAILTYVTRTYRRANSLASF